MTIRRVAVIGAGVSGLCASTYLRLSGYEVDLFELHDLPGGLCTAWQRGDYTFDGCLHWLVGSSGATPYGRLWREVVDMDAFEWAYADETMAIETRHAADPDGNKVFHLYADLDRLREYLYWIAPEDGWFHDRFIQDTRKLAAWDLPPNLDTAPSLQTLRQKLGNLKLLPFMLLARRWRHTNTALAARIKSPFLREVLENVFSGLEYPFLVILFQLSWFSTKSAGYPAGGSLAFARKLEERLRVLEGRVHYGARVERILVEEGRAVGVALADGTEHRADAVISAADGHWTLYEALSGRFMHDKHRAAYEGDSLTLYPSLLYVSLGVRRGAADIPRLMRFPLPEPIALPDGEVLETLNVQHYAHDPTLSPEGGQVLISMIESRNLDWWAELRGRDRAAYKVAKEQVADAVIAALDARFGGIAEAVEVVDVATPATWSRYTNNWQGSYEGWLPSRSLIGESLPAEVPGLDRFFMIGQWVEPGGGLPPALSSARNAVQVLCHRDGVRFMGQAAT